MAAETADQPRIAAGDGIQGVADVEAGDGPRRAFEFGPRIIRVAGEGDDWPVQAVLDARGEHAHHPLVPTRIVQTQADWQAGAGRFTRPGIGPGGKPGFGPGQHRRRLVVHLRLNLPAPGVDLIELQGQIPR